MKLVVVVSSIFMVERELVASSRKFVTFYQFIFPKPEILEEMWDCETDVLKHVPCSPLVIEWDSVVPLNLHPFYPSGKSSTVGIQSE